MGLLLSFIPIIIYTPYKTYYRSNNIIDNDSIKCDVDINYQEYTYNKRYNIIFWIFTIIQGYIFWIILRKPELIFMDTNILRDIPYIGEIIRIYSTDEKIMYLYNYFEYYVNLIDNEALNKDYLRYILRQLDLKILISNTVQLQDIQIYVKLLVDNYYMNEVIYHMLVKHLNNETIEQYIRNPWYVFMRNTLLIGAVTSTLIYSKSLWVITKQVNTPEGIYRLVKDIYLGTMKNKMTYEKFIEIVMKWK